MPLARPWYSAALAFLLGSPLACRTDGGTGPGTGQPVRVRLNVQPPESAQNGVVFDPAPVVELLDAMGEVVARRGVGIMVEIATGGGAILGTALVRTGEDGRAVYQDVAILGLAGSRTLRFTSPGLSAVLSRAIMITAGPAARVEHAGGNNQTAVAGTDLPVAPALRITDQSGNPVEGVAVTFEVTAGNGSLEDPSQLTGADGVARAGKWTLGTAPGSNQVTVTLDGLLGSPVVFSATATVGPPAVVEILEGDGQMAEVATAVDTAPAVRVTDAVGNPVAGVRVTFAVTSGNGAVFGASPTTDAQGEARVAAWILGAEPGPNTLTATAGTAPAVTFTATGVPPPDAVLAGSSLGSHAQRPAVQRNRYPGDRADSGPIPLSFRTVAHAPWNR